MPFGIGSGELIIIALVVIGLPVAALLLAAWFFARAFGPARRARELQRSEIAAGLKQVQLRIQKLEERVVGVDDGASFTQELLERRHPGP